MWFRDMVPAARLELARADAPRILSPLCLPFHHAGRSRSQCFTSTFHYRQVKFVKITKKCKIYPLSIVGISIERDKKI